MGNGKGWNVQEGRLFEKFYAGGKRRRLIAWADENKLMSHI